MIALLDDVRTTEQLDSQFVSKVLSPYFDHATYRPCDRGEQHHYRHDDERSRDPARREPL